MENATEQTTEAPQDSTDKDHILKPLQKVVPKQEYLRQLRELEEMEQKVKELENFYANAYARLNRIRQRITEIKI